MIFKQCITCLLGPVSIFVPIRTHNLITKEGKQKYCNVTKWLGFNMCWMSCEIHSFFNQLDPIYIYSFKKEVE